MSVMRCGTAVFTAVLLLLSGCGSDTESENNGNSGNNQSQPDMTPDSASDQGGDADSLNDAEGMDAPDMGGRRSE